MNPRLGMQPESRHSTCCRPYLGDQARRLEMIEIPLTRGQVALVDDEDFELVNKYSWQAQWNNYTKSFYARANSLKREGKLRPLYMHRIILNAGKGEQVDHINHATLDNRKENIRICSRSQNGCNRGAASTNRSGYKGVFWETQRSMWHSRITIDGKSIHLCFSDDPKVCYDAYCLAAKKYHGEFARVE